MTPERWKEINEVFNSVINLDAAERSAYLEKACSDDVSLREQVETLLAANDNAGTFIQGNAAHDATDLIEQNEDPDLSGESLRHYDILKVLGTGGMGKVYLARDSKLDRQIAIKTLPDAFSNRNENRKRFETEARAAATLNHPNVATIYSVEETDENKIFITMEYVVGQPLSDLFSVGGVDLRTFLGWFVPLSDALAHAHSKGVIHRDIKPNNILITDSGVPKILDFGLARINRSEGSEFEAALTKTGQVMGTPAYMSPEQAEGKSVDHRTDMFSLGVVMYEALTGKRPFPGDSYASIVSNLLTLQPPGVSELRKDVPRLISRLVMKCLEKNPQHRYGSMNEVNVLLREIDSALDSGLSLSVHESRNPNGRGKLLRVFAAVVIGALSIFGGWELWNWSGNERLSDPAVTRFSIKSPDEGTLGLFHADIAPDGSAVVVAARETKDKLLYLRKLDQQDAVPLAGTEDAQNPFFAADSKSIGFFNSDKTLKRIPLEGGNPLTICRSCTTDSIPYWGTNDLIIASDNEGLYSVSANGGAPQRLTKVDKNKQEISHHNPQFLPNNDGILFTIQGQKLVKFAVYSIKTGKTEEVFTLEKGNTDHGKSSLARFVKPRHLLYSSGRQLLAVKFEPDNGRVTGDPTPILDGIFSVPNFKLSNNGTLIYLPEAPSQNNQLVWVDRNGKESSVFDLKGAFQSPRLSPDGKRIAVSVENDIWIYEVSDGRGVKVTFEGENQVPLWAPDGKSVVYASKRSNKWFLFRHPVEGSEKPELLKESDERLLPYSWNPEADLIALASVPSVNNSDIVFLSVSDKSLRPVLSTEFKEDTPRFSPDNKWLAYFSTETGGVKVYVQPADGDGNKIAISKESGMFPVWSADGREIFYRKGASLVGVNLSASNEISVISSLELFSGKYLTSFDVASDGSKFLMVKNEKGSMPTQINVVLGWNQEFESVISSGK